MQSIRLIPRLAVMFLVFLLAACGSTTERLADALPTATTTVFEAAAPAEPAPTGIPEPTSPPVTATPEPSDLLLVEQGFGQADREVGFAFVVENPNSHGGIEDSQYQIAAYDAAGTVVETDSGYVPLVLPEQRLGIGGSLFLDEGVTVDRVEVQLNPGDVVATEPLPTFTSDMVSYYADDFSAHATGVIANPYTRDMSDLRVSALAYDEAGAVVGGGFTFLNFIPTEGTTGVRVPVKSRGVPTRVELHAAISGLTLLHSDTDLPDGAERPNLANSGFGQSDRHVGYGFVITNANAGFAIESSPYHATAYDAEGRVLNVDEGYVSLLLPGQTLGVGGELFLPEGTTVARLDVQLLPGSYVETEPLPAFTSTGANFQANSYTAKVTGTIANPYTQDVTQMRVSAVAFDEAGSIIGGGFTFLDFVPANGEAAVEVPVRVAGTPASVELHATLSSLSDFE